MNEAVPTSRSFYAAVGYAELKKFSSIYEDLGE